MPNNWLPLLSFILITTFTPGPNNITSASMGVVYGYRDTLNFQAGMTIGIFFIMLLSGWISASLLAVFPAVEPALRIAGALYILYLAYAILKASYTFDSGQVKPIGFARGIVLQVLNPKLIVYTLTLFSTFLAPITRSGALLALAAALLAATALCAASTWALFGTAIKVYLHRPRVKMAVNTVLALLLVYTAVELSGLL